MLRLSGDLPWEQVCCADPGDGNCPFKSLEVGLSSHTGPVLGPALSEAGDVSHEVDLSAAG